MKFQVNEFVSVIRTSEIKKIVDSELIDNQEIYYMDDNTSYHLSQITVDNSLSLDNKETLDYFGDFYKSYISSMSKKMHR